MHASAGRPGLAHPVANLSSWFAGKLPEANPTVETRRDSSLKPGRRQVRFSRNVKVHCTPHQTTVRLPRYNTGHSRTSETGA